jgi:mono/diheme cytochrome c family protein
MGSSFKRLKFGLILGFAVAVSSMAGWASEPALDLGALAARGAMPAAVEVTTGDDIVYGGAKRYEGYRLRDLLGGIEELEALRAAGAEIVFTAEDGYVATMALDDALAADGVVAFRDLDAPAGADWQTFKQGKTTTTPAPYYLVWPNQDPDDWAYPWPYQLATIAVEPFAARFGRAVPEGGDGAVREGFYVFKTYCLKCHSVNLAGGDLGPELNVPRSVIEYRDRAVLKGFIHDIASYRAASKMPSFTELVTADEVDRVLDYLTHMAAQKICRDATACDAVAE